MAQKKKTKAMVVSQEKLADGIYDLRLETELAQDAACGQFVGVYPKDKSTLLPRPISICEIDKEKISFVWFIAWQARERQNFRILRQATVCICLAFWEMVSRWTRQSRARRRCCLAAESAFLRFYSCLKSFPVKTDRCGLSQLTMLLKEDFEQNGAVYVATEDGSVGTKGNVMDAVAANGLEADIIYACGPMPMLRAIRQYAIEHDIPAYISLEERMACGVGACLGCVCKTTHKDAHSHVNNARICTDGPVFEAREVEI